MWTKVNVLGNLSEDRRDSWWSTGGSRQLESCGQDLNILRPATHNQVSSPGLKEMSPENHASFATAIPLLLVLTTRAFIKDRVGEDKAIDS